MNKAKVLLITIVILAAALRLYRLDIVPPSLSWDEAAVGYNSWTIANWGRDEYGNLFPAFFKSFGDDKHPVHIYSTAISVKLLGLSEFSTRLPAAVFGILNVILIFFLAKLMFSSEAIALFASFFLAISPYNIHFSRFNHEANFALFFFMLGLTLFYLAIKNKRRLLPLSVLSFAISFITYHPAKIVVPLVIILLVLLHGKQLLKNKRGLLGVLIVAISFSFLVLFNPQLLGIARVNQTSLNMDEVRKTRLFQLTNNEILGRLNLTLTQYSWHFSSDYLLISGDKNPRLSDQFSGQFYIPDALFLIAGVIFLLYRRSKPGILLLVWALVAPLPSALVSEAPHSARAMFMMGSWHAISAVGFYSIINLLPKPYLKKGMVVTTILILLFLLSRYLNYYYGEYAKKNAIDWQYGMKQIVEYIKDTEYSQVFTTDARSQPYIFFLYYLKVPLTEYLSSVVYNRSEANKSFNTVSYFDRYYFGGWDPVESSPEKGFLYVVTPSQYDGLKYKLVFQVKKVIYYPNGTLAYYIVSVD
ncbi:MAG: glycosyltransferase family 39 protein [Candidatus Daviesbacteria bacterium]|nr:glycosyltransferase family 39 protein [Candidatus Daviesbacteria bacterium]